jgi:anti-anti-sigma factor
VISEEKAYDIERWLDHQRQIVEMLASAHETRNAGMALLNNPVASADDQTYRMALSTEQSAAYAYETIDNYFTSVLVSHPDLLEIFVLSNPGGEVIFSTNPAYEGIFQVDARYFNEGRETTFVHPVYPSPVLNRPIITIATPLVSHAGATRGVLAAHINLDQLNQIMEDQTGLGATGETYLVDQYNQFVSSERLGTQEFPRGVHSNGINAGLAGSAGTATYANYARVRVLGSYTWLEEQQLVLLTEMQQTEAFAPARQLAGTIFAGGLFATGLLAVCVVLLAHEITRPIAALTRSATRIAQGDLTQRVAVCTRDEIGTMAHSFNQMTECLEGLYADIQQSEEQFRLLIENVSDIILIIDPAGEIRYESPSVNSELGYAAGSLRGQPIEQYVHPDDAAQFSEMLAQGQQTPGAVLSLTFQLRHADGSWRLLESRGKYLSQTTQGAGMVLNARDITAREAANVERARLQDEIIHMQAATLREMSTPLIPIADRVVIMPLIGAIDTQRAQQIMDTLLEGIAQHQAHIAILDITGVPVVDTQVAQTLIQAAQAVKLLGARVMLTGIQPQIAQTLVSLGIDLGSIITRGSLQAGIADALHAGPRADGQSAVLARHAR